MIKSSKFGDSVAAEMDKILSDESFKSIFAKATPEYSQAINQDPSYQAFVRIAKKQEKCECKKCECKKGKCVCKDDKKKDKKEDKKKDKVTKKAEEEVLALKYIYDTIISASEALDNMGLSKSASSALVLLDGIIKEAQITDPGVPFEPNKRKLEQPKNTPKIPETTPMPEPIFPPGEDVDLADDIEIDLGPDFGTRQKPIKHEEPPATNLKPNRPSTFDDSLKPKKPEVKPIDIGSADDVEIDLGPNFGTREKPIKHEEPPATNLKPNRPSTFDDSLKPKKPEVKPIEVGASIKDKSIIALFNKINKWTKEG